MNNKYRWTIAFLAYTNASTLALLMGYKHDFKVAKERLDDTKAVLDIVLQHADLSNPKIFEELMLYKEFKSIMNKMD